jgi:hypothetical protein
MLNEPLELLFKLPQAHFSHWISDIEYIGPSNIPRQKFPKSKKRI